MNDIINLFHQGQQESSESTLTALRNAHYYLANHMKKVFLVEDDPEIVQLLHLHFSEPHYYLTASYNGTEAIEKLTADTYDLIILDIMLPDIDGMEVCKRIRQEKILSPVIMLTSRSEEIDKVLALELGADDYITKPFSVRELMARVKAMFRRLEQPYATHNKPEPADELKIRNLCINKDKRQALLHNNRLELTAKEFDLLYLLASNCGKTFSRQQMLETVWGYSFKGYEHTVTSHINRLRMKIEPDINEPVYILTSWGVGYRFTE